jgi:hypothetical protein
MYANSPEHYQRALDQSAAIDLQRRLLEYIKDLRTDISELADGLQISRPTMQKFINAGEDTIELPKISRAQIYHLWETLTSPEKIEPTQLTRRYRRNPDDAVDLTTEAIRKQAIKNRKMLKALGPDELMVAAGFLPIQMKWIGVSPERYTQIMQMVQLLDNEILGFEAFMRVTQDQLEETIKAIDSEFESIINYPRVEGANSPSELIRSGLNKNPTIDPRLRNELHNKFEKAHGRILSEGHRDRLSIEEALGLFSTILSNELNQKERFNLKFRVINLEFRPLSMRLTYGHDFPLVRESLKKISLQAETELHTTASSMTGGREQLIPSVIQAVITCSYSPASIKGEDDGSREAIVFSYISCSTALNLATKAVALHLGFKESIRPPEIGTRKFGNKMASLVKCTATLECDKNGNHVQGDWVDRDFLKAYVQSLLIAGEKWIFFQIENENFNAENYLKMFQSMSRLDQLLGESRKSFHNYQFSEDAVTPGSLEKIAKDAQNVLKRIIPKKRDMLCWRTFEVNLSRIYLLAEIHRLRLVNMQGNLSAARNLISEISLFIHHQKMEEFLKPISMLFQTEEKLYALSSGQNASLFFEDSLAWEKWLTRARASIDKYLIRKSSLSNPDPNYPSDPDIDVYQCLGTIHSIAGRWLFYLGKTSSELELASQYFMRAAHYFSRIGLTQRVSRCFAIAGRVRIRMGDYAYAEQLQEMAYDLVRVQLHDGQRDAFKQSALSEIYLLQGEYELHAKNNYMKGLELSLQGLKGAMWLGLSRRTSDNLYNIWKCAQYLGDKTTEPLLKKVFPILWTSSDLKSRKEKKERLNPLENRIAEEVIDRLFEIQSRSSQQTWSQVAHQFQNMSSHIWHRWYQEAADDPTGHHPIGKLIDQNEFLKPVSD